MYLNGNFLRGAESMETGRLLKKLEEEVRDWLGKRGEPTKSAGFFRRSRKNFEKKEVVVIIRRKLYSV